MKAEFKYYFRKCIEKVDDEPIKHFRNIQINFHTKIIILTLGIYVLTLVYV